MANSTKAIAPGPLAGYATFERRRLVLSEAGVELVRKKTLSPSTVSAISSCGARYAIERLAEKLAPAPIDPFGAAELGTAVHQVYEDLFARPPGRRGLAAGLELLATLDRDHPELEAPKDPTLLARWRSEIQSRLVGLWDVEDPDGIDVVARELHVNVALDGIPFNGFVDRVHRRDGGLVVSDFKAGYGKMKQENARFGDPHGDQIRLYVRAIEAKRPDLGRPSAGEVLYVAHRKRREVVLSPEAMDGTKARYEKAWTLLCSQTDKGAFGMKVSPLCGWCPAVQVCPAALASGKVPRTDAVLTGALLGISLDAATSVQVPAAVDGSAVSDSSAVVVNPVVPNSAVVPDSPAFSEETYDPAVDFAATGSSAPDAPEQPAGLQSAPPSHQTKTRRNIPMSELKPWEETNHDGSLNLNSYASTAAFGLVELAVEHLHAAGQKITMSAVDALSETLALVVQHCQEILDVPPSLQDGSHTRLRGALRTSLETMPAPFGEDEEAWAAWVKRTEKRVLAIHGAALRLWSAGGQESEPWKTLAAHALKVA